MYTSQLQSLDLGTSHEDSGTEEKDEEAKRLLECQLLSQFVTSLQESARQSTLSREPRTFKGPWKLLSKTLKTNDWHLVVLLYAQGQRKKETRSG